MKIGGGAFDYVAIAEHADGVCLNRLGKGGGKRAYRFGVGGYHLLARAHAISGSATAEEVAVL